MLTNCRYNGRNPSHLISSHSPVFSLILLERQMRANITSGEIHPVAVRPACQSEPAGRFIAHCNKNIETELVE